MSGDKRKKLRAHWPPRILNHLQVTVPDWLYADLYLAAAAEGWSLAEEMRARLRAEMKHPATGRKPDRASAGQAAPPEGQPPAGGDTAREAP